MVLEKKDIMNELYDASLVTLGAVGISLVSSKLMKDNLGVNTTMKGILKLASAIAVGTVGVKYLQGKKLIPNDPFE